MDETLTWLLHHERPVALTKFHISSMFSVDEPSAKVLQLSNK